MRRRRIAARRAEAARPAPGMRSLVGLAAALADGAKSRGLVEECLARIDDPAGEGRRTFVAIRAGDALDAADHCDRLRARGAIPSPHAGIPVSLTPFSMM